MSYIATAYMRWCGHRTKQSQDRYHPKPQIRQPNPRYIRLC